MIRTGQTVLSIPFANPVMMVVAAPVSLDFTIAWVGFRSNEV